MSFWNTSAGTKVEGSAEGVKSAEIAVIPDKTIFKAIISEAAWKEFQGKEYIELKWEALEGEYKNRKVFQKLQVFDEKEAKADRAKEALYSLHLLCKATPPEGRPTDVDLMKALCNKPLKIRARTWEIDGKKGNWVDEIYPAGQVPKIDDNIPF